MRVFLLSLLVASSACFSQTIQIHQSPAQVKVEHNPTAPSDTASIIIDREATHKGGRHGWVNSALRVNTLAGKENVDFEWGILSVINSWALGGENVALYGQGNAYGAGPVWGMVAEARDRDPSTDNALVGAEIDLFANGPDQNNRRIGLDVVHGKHALKGAAAEHYVGLRISPQLSADGFVDSSLKQGLLLQGDAHYGIHTKSSGESAIRIDGQSIVGINLVGQFDAAAIRMKSRDKLQMGDYAETSIQFNPDKFRIEFSGAPVHVAESLSIPAGKVLPGGAVGARADGFIIMHVDGVGNVMTPFWRQ